ncbi:hypothetical protein HK102_013739 [Quaeritorhiza haematococci]|nr:hypothetical protein HK102_013739 [Quaeritorhiza haematococci]
MARVEDVRQQRIATIVTRAVNDAFRAGGYVDKLRGLINSVKSNTNNDPELKVVINEIQRMTQELNAKTVNKEDVQRYIDGFKERFKKIEKSVDRTTLLEVKRAVEKAIREKCLKTRRRGGADDDDDDSNDDDVSGDDDDSGDDYLDDYFPNDEDEDNDGNPPDDRERSTTPGVGRSGTASPSPIPAGRQRVIETPDPELDKDDLSEDNNVADAETAEDEVMAGGSQDTEGIRKDIATLEKRIQRARKIYFNTGIKLKRLVFQDHWVYGPLKKAAGGIHTLQLDLLSVSQSVTKLESEGGVSQAEVSGLQKKVDKIEA